MSPADLRAAFFSLRPLHAALAAAAAPLAPRERQRQGGWLWPDGPGLVHEVARALSQDPALFPDSEVSGADLKARQEQAAGWLALRDRLQILARLCADAHVQAQAEATQQAVALIKRARGGPPPPGIGADRRVLSLLPALLLHAAHQGPLRRAAKPQGPAQERAKSEARAAVREKLRRQFTDWLARAAPP